MNGGFLFLDPSPEKKKGTVTRGPSQDVYFEISPVHKQQKKKEIEEDVPVLRLTQFNHPPKISFETVKLGTTRQRRLHVSNPKNDPQELYCEKPPSEDNGFTCSTYRAVIQPAETIELVLTWSPNKEGSVREVLHWKTNLGVRSQIIVMGTCVDPDSKKKAKGRGRPQNKVVGRRTGVAPEKGGHIGKVPSRTTSISSKSSKENMPCKSTALKARNVDSKHSKTYSFKEKETKRSSQVLKEANRRVPNFKANRVKPHSMNSTQKLKVSEGRNIHLPEVKDLSVPSITLDEDPACIQQTDTEVSRYGGVSISEGIDLRRMTYSNIQNTCIVEESEEVITEVEEYECYVTHHEGETFSSCPVQIDESSEIISSRMVSQKEEFFRTHNVALSPLRRQTFVTRPFAHDNLSDCEEVEECEDGHLTIEHLSHETPPKLKEIYSEIMSGGSHNETDTTASSRKTFFKAAHKPYKTEKLAEGNTVASQQRHQTLATGKEMFHTIHKGYLPPCQFENSPARRQTYIKGVATEYQGIQNSEHTYLESPYLCGSQYNSSNSSTPCEYKTTAQKNLDLGKHVTTITPVPCSEYFDQIKAKFIDLLEREDDLDSTPCEYKTPAQKKSDIGKHVTTITPVPCSEYFDQIKAKFIDLLEREDDLDDIDPDSVLEQVAVSQKLCASPEPDMHTAPVSPSSDFETAPSTPTDEELPRLNEIHGEMDDIFMLVEMELKSADNMNKDKSVHFDEVLCKERCLQAKDDEIMRLSLETVVRETALLHTNEMENGDEKCGSKNQQRTVTLDDLSLLIEKDLRAEGRVDKDKSVKFEEELLCKQKYLKAEEDEIRRLSSETVVKDTSILHPDEIVRISEKCGSNETLVKEGPSLSPSMLHHVTDTYTPRRKSTHGILSNSEEAKITSRRQSLPVIHCNEDYQSRALEELMQYKNTKGNDQDENIENCKFTNEKFNGTKSLFGEPKIDDTTEKESFVLASEADFKFSPNADSRRCSTCIKPDPPEDVDSHNVVLEKCRTLFLDLDEDQNLAPEIPESDISDICLKSLSTIEEIEEDLSFSFCRKMPDRLKNRKRTNNTFEKTSSLVCENSNDKIGNNTFETKPLGLTFIKQESAQQRDREPESPKGIGKKEKDPGASVFVENSLDCKPLKNTASDNRTSRAQHITHSDVKEDSIEKMEEPSTTKEKKTEDQSLGVFMEISPPQKAKAAQTTGRKPINVSCVEPPLKDFKSCWSRRSRVNPTPASRVDISSRKTTQEKSGNKQPVVLSTKCKSLVKNTSCRAGSSKPGSNFKKPEDKVGKSRDQTQKQTAVKKRLDASRKSSSNPQLGSTTTTTSLSSTGKNMSRSSCSLNNSTNSQTSLNSSTSSRRSGIGGKKSTGLRVPQAKLTLIKMQKTMLVHHPNPYIARNMFYDDRWIEKQVAGFTKWLNFVLTPPEEETVSVDASKADVKRVWNEANKSSRIMLAPSKETLSLRAYTARRKLNRLRRKACQLYQSAECVEFIGKMETAIGKKYLMIRKDRHTHADIGLKQQLLQLVLCYNPLWLRIGLETIYGELVHLESNSDITGLTYFIINRLVNNPDIQSQFAHPSVPHSYRNGYEDALKAFQLKKFLLLVYFLELAKTNRLIHHDPCLFNKNALHKSSRDILIAFAAEFLSGVGDITKHLAYLGYDVKHKQTLLDEFDYAVSNLAVDLRCGIRLTRVIEMLTMDTNYSKKLRVPAVSRTQKVHNTEVAFSAISANGIPDIATCFSAKDIVDGHREQTLGLLWTIMFKFQLQTILKEETILEEIEFLRRSLRVRAAFGGEAKKGLMNIEELLKEFDETLEKPKSEDYLLTLLKAWAMLICAHYAVQVENLSVSFSDGRALCLLLHHYHAEILPRDLIKWETTQNMPIQGIDLDVSLDDSFSDMTYTDTKEEFQKRLANEKDNFILLGEKVSQLGGVPHLIRGADMINTIPDEKVTSLFVAYLCARLLDLSTEIKAARIIQVAWRKRMTIKRQRELQIRTAAACFIQRWWRGVLHRRQKAQYEKAAVILQSHWRRRRCQIQLKHLKYQKELKRKHQAASIIQSAFHKFLLRKRQQKIKAASVIQNAFRTWQQRKIFRRQRKAAIVIQSFARMVATRSRYIKQIRTLVGVQRRYRAKLQERNARKELGERMTAAVRIQRWFRMILAMREAKREVMQQRAACIIAGFFKMCITRNRFLRMREAAVIIQSQIRMIQQRDRFDATMRAVMVLQDHWRATLMMRRVREQYLQLKEVVIFLQAHIRAYIQKKKFHLYRRSAITIQSHFRGWRERQKFVRKREAVKVIQEYWCNYQKARSMQQEFILQKRAALTIQTVYRCYSARKKYQEHRSAAVIIQSHIRMVLHRKKYNRKLKAVKTLQIHLKAWKAMKQQSTTFQMWKTSAVKIQAVWRGFQVRQGYRQLQQASVILQSAVRGWSAKKRYKKLRDATSTIQSRYRAKLAMEIERNKYQQLQSTTVHLQALIRGNLARRRYREIRSKVIKTQAYVRGWIQRRQYQKQLQAVAVIQEWYRANQAMKKQRVHYQLEKEAAVVIQSYVRMYLHRKEYIRKLGAIRTLQTYVRAHNTRKEQQRVYQVWKASAVKIQTTWRGFHARREYKKKQKASVVLQSAVKGWCARRYYKRLRSATLIIQSRYRAKRVMEKDRNKFQQLQSSTIHLQALVRGWLWRKQYQKQLKAATVIQSWYRATLVMKEQKQLYQQKKSAAVVIQSQVRMLIQRRIFIKKWRAVKTLQTQLRSWKAMKQEQRKYQLWKSSVIKIQAAWRGFHVRQHYRQLQQASVVLQSAVRGWCARKHYKNLKAATLIIQSRYRAISSMKRDRTKFLQLQANTVHLQSLIRGYLARRRYRDTLGKIIKTQAYIRGWVQHRQYQKQVKAVVAIQEWYRANRVMKEQKMHYQREKEAVIVIQSHIRMVLQRRTYIRKMRAVKTLQTRIKAWKAMKEQQKMYQLRKASVVKIQAAWRGFHIRQGYKQLCQASLVLQSAVRRWSARKYYKNLRMATVTIQSRYRAKRVMQQERNEFQQLRGKIVHLQALIRGYLVRKRYREIHTRIIKIQAYVRGWIQRRQYQKRLQAVAVIQEWYRATRVMRKQRVHYQLEKEAAIIIQSNVRMYLHRKKYIRKLGAIKTLQTYVRAHNTMREQQRTYQLWKTSAVKIQTAWRSFCARKEYKQIQRASVVLQSAVKGWCARRHYKSLRSAALIIQSRYRAKRVMKKERNEFQLLQSSTIRLQAQVRGWLQRKQYQKQLKAAIVIQSWYKATRVMKEQKQLYQQKKSAAVVIQSQVRMLIQRRIFIKKWRAVNTLQTRLRSWKAMKQEQRKYQLWKSSVIKIQAAWRGFHVRQHYRQLQQASVVLQSAVRGWCARKHYKNLKAATLIIQSQYRAISSMKRDRTKFLQLQANAVHLQSLIRGYLARQRLKEKHAKVIKAQAYIRGWLQYRQYQKQVKAVVAIQMWYRTIRTMKEQRIEYYQMKQAVVLIQANARRLITRSWFLKQKQAAVVVQKHIRGMLARSRYQKMQQKACVIQRYVRTWLLSRKVSQEFTEIKTAAITIQAHYRGHRVRMLLKKKSDASTTIQSWYRMSVEQQNYVKKRKAALVIQRHYRAYMEACKTRQQYLLEQSACVTIQSFWRMYVARKRYTNQYVACITIQQYVRAYLSKRSVQGSYLQKRDACIKAQTWVRMFLAKNRYLAMKEAALKIQEFYRAAKAGQEARRTYQQYRQATISIQSWYRMVKQRQRFKKMKHGANVIQKYVRGYQQMKKLRHEYREKRQAVILIQSKVRGWLQHKDYMLRKSAAIRIQTWFRTHRAMHTYKQKRWAVITLQKWYRNHRVLLKARKEYKATQSALVILQAFARGMIVRKQFKQRKESAIVIQKYYRMWKMRTLFIHKREAVKKIQSFWRSAKETRKQREEFLRKRLKILTLQTYIRGYLVRKSVVQRHEAATIVQAAIRGWQAKRGYRRKLDAVVKLQEYWRGACLMLRCREDFIYKRRAAVILQTAWRRQLARRELNKRKAARVIQAYVRGWQVRQAIRSKKRQEYLCKVANVTRYHTAAITIQRAYRRHVEMQGIQEKVASVVIIQTWFRAKMQRIQFIRTLKSVQVIQKAWRRKLIWIHMAKERKAITSIQAAWRGYKVRKHMDKRLSHVCQRLEKASKGTQGNTVGNRTESAIAFLLKYKDLKHVLMAVMTLDVSTRLSTVCCKKLVEGACLSMLNFFLCSANRSVPHIQILEYILNILINLVKYPYSAPYVFEMENIVEVLVRLMNLYHEKGPSLFNKCATVLFFFAISPQPHQDLTSKTTDALERLHTVMVRKETASLRGKRQAKLNLSKCPVPCLVPEWSMRPGWVREFKFPIPAITVLLQKLRSLSKHSSGKQ